MVLYARATRALRKPSLDARSAVEDQSVSIPEKTTSELGGIILMDDGRRMRALKASLATPCSFQPYFSHRLNTARMKTGS
jgi:hypothetical protein